MDADVAARATAAGDPGRASLRGGLWARCALAFTALVSLYVFAHHASPNLGPSSSGQSGKISAERSYGHLPLAFEPNTHRAADPGVDFIARSHSRAAFIRESGATLAVSGRKRTHAIGLQLVGSAPAEPRRLERLPGVVNDLHGDDAAGWRTGIPTYARVRYSSVYPGIDVEWHGNERQLEYDFRVAAGADPGAIAVRVTHADRLRLASNGDVVIKKGRATFRQKAPAAYQRGAGGRTHVAVRFQLDGGILGFHLGRYDRHRPLVIDPTVLAYATYLGGNGPDAATGIAVDGSGAAYMSGRTLSSDFDTSGQLEGDEGDSDAFIAKLNPAGDALQYSTYVGGGGADRANGVAVDSAGAVYAVGTTESTDFNTVNGIPQDPPVGDRNIADAFVLKLSPAGDSLAYSTYLGGSSYDPEASIGGPDEGAAIAVDSTGAAYVAGSTDSGNFPTTANRIEGDTGELETGNGKTAGAAVSADAFISKLNPSGTALEYSTYLGGDRIDAATGIAVDQSGAAYVTGTTDSTNLNTVNPIEGHKGGFDAFVSKLDPEGDALVYSTYLGDTDYDAAHAIALDDSGAAYITGTTQSAGFDTKNEIEGDDAGPDAFVSKLAPDGTSLEYSTFLAGGGADSGNAIDIDSAGTAYVAGHTESSDFDTAGAIEGDEGSADAFVSSLAPDGTSLGCSTYLGGAADDRGRGIAVGPAGTAYVAGSTESSDFNHEGGLEGDSASTDAFVSKLDLSGPCAKSPAGSGPPNSDQDLRVYVMVLDGLRPEEVKDNLTPTLYDLKQNGTWYDQARSVLIAETLPNHAAMMTGTLPQRNGVFANDFWEPGGAPKFRMMLPQKLQSETLFTSLEESCDVSTAAVMSKFYLWRLFAGEAPNPSDPVVQRPPDYRWNPVLDPAYINKPDEHTPDVQTMNNGFLPWVSSQPSTPQFAFVNLGDIDRSGHIDTSGPYAPGGLTAARQAALTDTDRLLGDFVDQLKTDPDGGGPQHAPWDETVLIFTSDHGMDWSTPDHRMDAAVEALSTPGLAFDSIEKYVPNGGAAMLYIKDGVDLGPIAEQLMTTPGIDFVATRTRVAPDLPTLHDVGMDHPSAGDIVVFAKPGWRFDVNGVADSNPLPGNHGHSPTQNSTLLVTGGHPALDDAPEDVPGELVYGPNDDKYFAPPAGGPGNLSIAPTVAALFGVEPPPGGYDGKPLVEAFDDGALDGHTPCGAGSKLPPAPDLTIGDVSVPEGDDGTRDAVFTVSLAAPYPREVTVDYATSDGTAGQPGDYEARTGTVTFAPNQTSKTIGVPVKGDTDDEPDETFQVELSNISNANLADGGASGTIVDDDDPPPPSGPPESGSPAPGAPDGGSPAPTPPLGLGDILGRPPVMRCDGSIATIVGTVRPDRARLVGTSRRDVIAGLGGADRADGRGGADSICGGHGNDVLRGGSGRDRVKGGRGADVIIGGSGADTLIGGGGRDRIDSVGGSRDRIDCGGGFDVVRAGPLDRVAGSCERVHRRRSPAGNA